MAIPIALQQVLTVFAATTAFALLAAVANRCLPHHWIEERHNFAFAMLVAVPLVWLITLQPRDLPDSFVVEAASTGYSIDAAGWEDSRKTSGHDKVPKDLTLLILGLWLLGSAVSLLKLGREFVGIRLLRGRATPVRLPQSLQLSVPLPIRLSHEVHSPLLIGYRNPTIVLPMSFEFGRPSLPVLEHEVAHALRHDNWTTLLLRLLQALFWWNLPQKVLQRTVEECREVLCDDRAVRVTQAPHDLAAALLTVAADAARARHSLAASTASGAVVARLRRLTCDAKRARSRPRSLLPFTAAAIVGVLATIPRLGPAAPVDAASAEARDTAGESALGVALNREQFGVAKRLLVDGVDPDARDLHGDTLLVAAVRRGDEAAVSLLMAAGANPQLQGSDGFSAVELARRAPGLQIDGMLTRAGGGQNPQRLGSWPVPRSSKQPDCTPVDLIVLGECYRFLDTDKPVQPNY